MLLGRKERPETSTSVDAGVGPATQAGWQKASARRTNLLSAAPDEDRSTNDIDTGGELANSHAGHLYRPYPVELDALREVLPDNLFWVYGAPTDDPDILAERKRHAAHLDEIFGRIQSNTATEEEIAEYYDHKEKLSKDYLTFTQTVLQQHADELSARDLGLYQLSESMHIKRLREYPKDRQDAKRRKAEQDRKREAWMTTRK